MPNRPPSLGPKRLVLTDPALDDLDRIIEHIAGEAGSNIAIAFADRLDAHLFDLAELGHSGVSREWIAAGLRLSVVRPYCIYFRVTDTETIIIRVLHGARDVDAIVFEP